MAEMGTFSAQPRRCTFPQSGNVQLLIQRTL